MTGVLAYPLIEMILNLIYVSRIFVFLYMIGSSSLSSVPRHYSVRSEADDKLIGMIGQMVLTVKKGDITKEKVDAIVNSTSATFDQQGVYIRIP